MKETVTLLLIGYGYVARATARAAARRGARVIATTRSDDTAREIEAAGFAAAPCDPATREGAERLRALALEATHIISSVPPGRGGDPVLTALEGQTLDHAWLGYLSTTGVYGDRQGGWAFEWEIPTPGTGPIGPARRGRSGLDGQRRAPLPALGHLWSGPLGVRSPARGPGAPHRQSRTGLFAHPCRGHCRMPVPGDGPARPHRRLQSVR